MVMSIASEATAQRLHSAQLLMESRQIDGRSAPPFPCYTLRTSNTDRNNAKLGVYNHDACAHAGFPLLHAPDACSHKQHTADKRGLGMHTKNKASEQRMHTLFGTSAALSRHSVGEQQLQPVQPLLARPSAGTASSPLS
jgi:hypothetical protein